MNRKRLKILVADDHELLRTGVRCLLESHPGWTACAEYKTRRECVAKAEELRPDIVVLDIAVPEVNGIEVARRILKASAGTGILLLLTHCTDRLMRKILNVGIRGYILKSDSARDLV